jgi:PAS domain S-box-containing protein
MLADRRATILAVDNDRFVLELISVVFSSRYAMLCALDGVEALDMAIRDAPDLILLDVDMPGLGGFEVCARLKADQRTANIPIIFITAFSQGNNEVRGLELGAEDFIAKPVKIPVLKARVEQVLRRVRAEAALRDREQRLRLAQQIAKIGDFTWNVQTGEATWSDSLYDLLGYNKTEIIDYARVNSEIHHPDDLERVTKWLNDCIESGSDVLTSNEYRLIRKDKKVIHVHATGIIERDNDQVTVFATLQDITERKRAEEKVLTFNQQLEKTNVEKDTLFSIIAHDLKSPMSGLLASTGMLADQSELLSEQDIRTIAKGMHRSTRNTCDLLEDLLQWSRMNQGGIDYAPTQCSLKELVTMGLHSAQDIAKNKDISLRQDIAPGLTVKVDQPMIKTVIRNILFNAIKFTPRRGEIVITARQSEQKVTVAVQDTGVGMNEQMLSIIFTHETRKRQLGTEGEKGTGLGLVLCKQFIDQHGGRIWVESEPGKGTTVFFTLPVCD